MKKMFCILSFMAVAVGVSASTVQDKKIVVRTADGVADYSVKSVCSIKFNDGTVIMNLQDGASQEWAPGVVECMAMEVGEVSPGTAVDAVAVQDISLAGGVLDVRLSSPAPVVLSTIEGKVLLNVDSQGAFSVRMSAYPAGVYILKVDGRVYKIVNR